MAWEVVTGGIAGASGIGALVGAIFSRRKIKAEASLTSVGAAETVNTMLVNQVRLLDDRLLLTEQRYERVTADYRTAIEQIQTLRNQVHTEKEDCDRRLQDQQNEIERLKDLMH